MNVTMKGIKKLNILSWIILKRLESKLDAIIKATGGPNTIQQKNAIKKSAEINKDNLFLLERFFKNFPIPVACIIIDLLINYYN